MYICMHVLCIYLCRYVHVYLYIHVCILLCPFPKVQWSLWKGCWQKGSLSERRSMNTGKLHCPPWQAGRVVCHELKGWDCTGQSQLCSPHGWGGEVIPGLESTLHIRTFHSFNSNASLFCWLHGELEEVVLAGALALPFCTAVCN